MSRNQRINAFINNTKWKNAERSALQQDASFRRYWRLNLNGETCLLMDAPPPEKPVSTFSNIANFLRENDLLAPAIIAIDDKNGFLLLQDFGNQTFTKLLADEPHRETELYQLAIDSLIKIHHIQAFKSLSLSLYNEKVLIEEARLLIEWFYPAITGRSLTRQHINSFNHAWQQCLDTLPNQINRIVLRDYHVDNLMMVDRLEGKPQCGLLDFQDALIGSPAYDVISLLEDARRDVSIELKSRCLERYFSGMASLKGFPSPEDLMPWMNVLAAQRHAKVLGIFVRLYKRDHKPDYLIHLPRTLNLFKSAVAREPLLNPIQAWLENYMPLTTLDLNAIKDTR